MKLAPLYGAFRRLAPGIKVEIIHTGQHYDSYLSTVFERELQIPSPKINLEVSGGDSKYQRLEVEKRYKQFLLPTRRPQMVIVLGDVNATLGTSKAAETFGIPVAHIEAGLRSFDHSMPEEYNRIETDKIATYHFASETSAINNLKEEGLNMENVFLVGNIMLDTLVANRERANQNSILKDLGLRPKEYFLFSTHRPSNVDQKEDLIQVLRKITICSSYLPTVFPIHPRTKKKLIEFDLWDELNQMNGVKILDPLGYHPFLKLQMHAKAILTDSGGVQEESSFLNIPCLTLRVNTERPITLEKGTNLLVGGKSNSYFKEQIEKILKGEWKNARLPSHWDGNTAERIVNLFRENLLK